VAIARELALPIRFLGIGEQAADFGEFQPEAFVDALLGGAAGVK
jgi:fused signal recognition particle receptor